MSKYVIVDAMTTERLERDQHHPAIETYHLSHEEEVFLTDIEKRLYDVAWQDDLIYDQAKAFEFFQEAGKNIAKQELLPELQAALEQFAKGEVSVLVVPTNVHAPDDMPTPTFYRTPEQKSVQPHDVRRALMLSMMGLEAYGYTSQQPGNLWNDVIAIQQNEGQKGASANTKSQLGFHTEDASYNKSGGQLANGRTLPENFDASPDVLSIHFQRNPLDIPTTVSAPDTTRLSEATREALRQPFFMNKTNPGQGGSENDIDVPTSILYGDSDKPNIRANIDNLVAVDERGRKALDEFMTLVHDPSSIVELPSKPGDIIFINNRLVLHGRSLYPELTPENERHIYGPESRWQKRLVAMKDRSRLAQFETTQGTRIINPERERDQIEDYIKQHTNA